MKTVRLLLCLWGVVVLCAGCGGKADFDVRGTWDYVMQATDGNTYDEGTITFSGQPDKGTYLQVNIYEVAYEGDYTVRGTTITLSGDESWDGEMGSDVEMGGSWRHAGEAEGTWAALKQVP